MATPWYSILADHEIFTPQLVVYPERIEANIDEMIRIAGTPDRLRPHVKTYKCREIIELQIARGIHRFKCATLAEAALLGEASVADVLLAYPLIGPSQKRFLELRETFPRTKFSVLIDSAEQLTGWNAHQKSIDFFIDVNVGMNRTGASVSQCLDLFKQLDASDHTLRGWHCYDGHNRLIEPHARENKMITEFEPILSIIQQTATESLELVTGGSITFPIHAQYPGRTLSPGTTLLWDHGYAHQFADLKLAVAAIVVTRIVSKPGADLVCLDAGHKAVASEMPADSLFFPELPDARKVTHSEEHLVVKTSQADSLKVGQLMYGIPYHICPTVALHDSIGVIEDGRLTERWTIGARNRVYV